MAGNRNLADPRVVTVAPAQNLAELRSIPGSFAGQLIQLIGTTTPGDSGYGWFRWNATSTAADDGADTIAVTGYPTGRWSKIDIDQKLRAELASSATGLGSALVTYQPAGTGAVARTVQTELNGKRIENIADLRNFAGVSTGDVVHVTSYYSGWAALAEGPTGGGFFVWDGASTATHNGGTIISLNAGGTGRWKRPDQRNITIRQFGAKGDGTDFTTIFQTALNSNTSGVDLYFEPGDYLLSGAVTDITYDNTTIRGAGGKLSKIFVTAPNASIPVMLRAQSSTATRRKNINIEGLYFHGGGTVRIFTYTGAIQFTNTQDSSIRNCYFEKMSAVVVFFGRFASDNAKYSDNIEVSGNTLRDCYSDGIYGQVFRNSRITNNHAFNVGTDGDNMPYLFEGIRHGLVTNNTAEDCLGTGIMVSNYNSDAVNANSTVAANVLKKCGVYGIFSAGTFGLTISANAVFDTGTLSGHQGIILHDPIESLAIPPIGARMRNVVVANSVVRSGGAGIAVSTSGNLIANNQLEDNNTSNTANVPGIELFNNAGGTTNPHYNKIEGNYVVNTILNEEALVNGNTKYAVSIPTGAGGNEVLNNTILYPVTGLILDNGHDTLRRGNRHAALVGPPAGTSPPLSGRAVLVAGTVTVSTSQVEANDNIILSRVVTGGTQGTLSVGTITAATSFVINSSNAADTSTIYWEIVH